MCVLIQHWPETIKCFCSTKMDHSKRKPKRSKPLTRVSGARTPCPAASTSRVAHSITLTVYATDAPVHPSASPSPGTSSKSAQRHSWEKTAGWGRCVPKATLFQGNEGHRSSVLLVASSDSRRAQNKVCQVPGPCDQLPHHKPQCVHTSASFSPPPQTTFCTQLLVLLVPDQKPQPSSSLQRRAWSFL